MCFRLIHQMYTAKRVDSQQKKRPLRSVYTIDIIDVYAYKLQL